MKMNGQRTVSLSRPSILILASHYRDDHVNKMKTYRPLNKAASKWNNALFGALKGRNLDLHIVQFYPVLRRYKFSEDNITYYYLPHIPKIDKFTSRLKWFRVRQLVKMINPNLIHGIGSEHGYAYAALFHNRPSVITIHGYMRMISQLEGHKSWLKQHFLVREESKALACTDTVIAINGFMKDQFIKAGCQEEKIHIIPNAITDTFLSPCPDSTRDIDILMVGTLHQLKNHHVMLNIISVIKARYGRSPSVVVAGAPTVNSANYYKELIRYKQKEGLDNVEFVGSVDHVRLKELYCSSKILLHISEFETDSMVISEAMACGTLPVVNPVASLSYRIQDHVNGRYIPINDIHLSAELLISILDNPIESHKIALEGQEAILKERPSKTIADKTAVLYQSLV